MKYGMDCLLFLDDDEYPVAVTKNRDSCLWSGQRVLLSHMENIVSADYTIGLSLRIYLAHSPDRFFRQS
jgi:hypothetical protein